MYLNEIAHVFTGLSNRNINRGIKTVKRITQYNPIEWEYKYVSKSGDIPDYYYLKKNDIILISSIYNRLLNPYLYTLDEDDIISQPNSIVIRIFNNNYLPEYIIIYLKYIGVNNLELDDDKKVNRIKKSILNYLFIPDKNLDEQLNIIEFYYRKTDEIKYLQDKLILDIKSLF